MFAQEDVMDIQKEREAFEVAYSEIFAPIVRRPYPVLENGDYKYIEIDNAWKLWQSKPQAVPEGFVLMPIKPTETMVMAVVKEHEGDAFLPYSLYDAYVKQAMIEAQEQSHEH